MSRAIVVAALLSAACSSGTVTATVVNELTGDAIPNVAVTLRAQEEVSFSCQIFEMTTNEAGVATVDGPCLSSTGYSLSPVDGSLWFVDGAVAAQGGDGSITVQALYAPSGSGAYLLRGSSLTPLSTHSDIKHATITGSEEVVEYPRSIPQESDVPRIADGSWLVLVGVSNVETARLVPLVQSGPRRLTQGEGFITMQDWWYLGVRFASDTEFTRQAAMVDDSRAIRKSVGDRAAYIIPADAVPSGRYALRTSGSNRITVLDFGAPTE